MSKISLVIPNWNGQGLLEKNMPFWITAKKNKKNNISEIVIVDDKSSDDSVKFLRETYKDDTKIVCHKQNRGFAAAVNTGFRSARFPFVCLLNTDVIPKQDFLKNILTNFKDIKVFGVSLHEKSFAYASGAFENGFIVHRSGKEINTIKNTFWVSGGSGVFRRSYWMHLGGLDESLFSPFYWKDVDLSYRALKRGYKLLWNPKARVVHMHEAVINKSNFAMWRVNLIKERNYLLFNWKNLTSSNLVSKHRKALFKKIRLHPGYLKVVLFALLKWKKVVKARRVEKKEQVISDEAIFESFR